ncbi:MAG: ATP-binding protein [bacterium]|nr:ATP-binding protein [bacterium]
MNIISSFRAARFVPAVILLSTILLLTLILASLGRKSMDREKDLLLELKERQARTMVRAIASASRISAMMGQRGQQLDRFVVDTAQSEDVIFIVVYDNWGHLIAASPGFSAEGQGLIYQDMRQSLQGVDHLSTVEYLGGVGRVFFHVGKFHPLDSSWIHLRLMEIPSIPGFMDEPEEMPEDTANLVVIAMDVGDLDAAVTKGMKQALLNGFLLLLLGTIGFYFLILVQGYYSTRRALSEFRQYTLDVIDGMAEGFVSIDHDGVLRTINAEAERDLEITGREYLGKPWQVLFEGEEWEPVLGLLERQTPFYDVEISPGRSGRTHLRASMTLVRRQEGVHGMVVFLRDMGEVKGLQAEVRRSERLAALGRLVAGMAHEIRNPLNSIRGFSQHLKGRFEPGTSEGKALDVIVKEVDRLNRVITDLLDFSRPREPALKDLDLNDVVRSVLDLVGREAANQGVTVVKELEDAGAAAMGDLDGLKQLLLNLFLNALQAMPDGGVLTIRTKRVGGRTILSLSDTGPGIPEEDQERIFEPFFTTRDTGTGLGLSIAHRIVLDHGADIRVESKAESGTSFVIRFPEYKQDMGNGATGQLGD